MSEDRDRDRGPIESHEWPNELLARAITPGAQPRMFGYDVEDDLAPNYRFSDVIYLSLAGELPSEAQSRAFEAVLVFASAMSVAEAPIHAAVLARLCGARVSGVLSASAIALAEHADRVLESIGDTLEGACTTLPEALSAKSDEERRSVRRLARLVGDAVSVPVFALDPSRDLAIVATVRACGITSPFRLASALALARIPSAVAEAGEVKPGDFLGYPMDTPHFAYEAPPPRGSDR